MELTRISRSYAASCPARGWARKTRMIMATSEGVGRPWAPEAVCATGPAGEDPSQEHRSRVGTTLEKG